MQKICPDSLVKTSKDSSNESFQREIPLAFGLHRAPSNAPSEVVRQARDTAHALQIAMKAAKVKAVVLAKIVGCHESYVSLLKTGKRPITEALVGRLCIATQSALVAQVFAREETLRNNAQAEVYRLAELMRRAAA
jgi:ADP-ribosylglycohydrolase